MTTATARDLAAEALELVGRDPAAALAMADRAVAAARGERDAGAGSAAHRAAGLALREMPDLASAERRLRTAIGVAARGGEGAAQDGAQARMSLALVLLDQGRFRAALGAADRAALVLRGLPAARLKSQRGLILQRAGRLDEATAAFGEALPVLRRFGDALWEARVLNNRGLLNGYQGALTAAEADLERARQLHLSQGFEKFAADVDWNRGFVATRRGDVPTALARFDAAESALSAHGAVHPQLLLDRTEALLTAGLADEARRTARQAIERLRAAGQHTDLAEGLVLLARAALDGGDAEEAASAARRAQAEFSRQGRSGWTLLAGVIELRAAELAQAPAAGLLRSALARAGDLAAVGWRAAELDARLTAAQAATRLGRAAQAREQLALASAARRSSSLDVRTRAWHATAMLRAADGHSAHAMAAVRAGLAAVEQRQAAVGSTEFRVHVAAHGVRLARLGLSLALAGRDPQAVLGWAERVRARSLRLPLARPPADEELAEALAESRRLSAELLQAQLGGASTSALVRRQQAAELRVVQASRTAHSPFHVAVGAPPGVAELVGALGEATLVEYIVHEGALLAVTLRGGTGRCRLHRLGSMEAVADQVEAAGFGLRRMALGLGTARSVRRLHEVTVAAGRALEELLVAPLRHELGDRPLVVVPSGALHAVPWGLVPALAGRPVRIAPSASAWLRAVRGWGEGEEGVEELGRVVLAAGPGLARAETEIAAIGREYPEARRLVGEDATAEEVAAALDGARLAHIAAHGRLRTDNPLFSALVLADGPLTVYDLERLTRPPRLVVLPACHSGSAAVHAGDELMGLSAALLALGTRTVVATVAPVHDAATAELMQELHRRLRAGETAESALCHTRSDVGPGRDEPLAWASVAAFNCFGG